MINVLLAGVGGQGTVLAAKVLAQAAQSKGWQVRTAETIGMAQRGGNVTSHVRMGSEGEEVFSSLITPGTADMVIALEPGEAARALPYLAPGGVLVTATTAIQPVTAALASVPYRAGDVVAALANSLQAEAPREQAAEEGGLKPAPTVVIPTAGDAGRLKPAPTADTPTTDDPTAMTSSVGAGFNPPARSRVGHSGSAMNDYPVPLFVPVDDEALVRELGDGSRKSLNMMLLAVAVAQGRIPLTVDELKAAVQACVKSQFVAMNQKAIDHAAEAYG